MTRKELLSRITIDPMCVLGSHASVGTGSGFRWSSISSRAEGAAKEILDDYPGLDQADILACIAYGAEMARERYVDVPVKAS